MLLLRSGMLVDVALHGVSVETDLEDVEASYGKAVRLEDCVSLSAVCGKVTIAAPR